MSDPLVSVIIPSYNRYAFLENAVKSVLDQSYNNIEVFVVNDESTEQDYYLKKFPNIVNQINVNRSDYPNWGGSRQPLRNIAAKQSSGKYLAFLDDDDIWLPKKLEVQIEVMENSSNLISSTEGYYGEGVYNENSDYPKYNSEHFFKILKRKYRRTNFLKQNKFPSEWTYEFLSIHNCIILSSTVIRKDLYDRLGGFRGLPRLADYDLWLNALKLTNLDYIDVPLFYYDGAHGSGKNYT